MATRTFHLNTEPHQAVIGPVTLLFQPEAVGSEFLTAYGELRDAQRKVTGGKATSSRSARAEDVSPEALDELAGSMRRFIGRFLTPESLAEFEALRLPDRILVQLIEFMAELYGGGSGNPDAAGGTSTD